MGRSTNPSSVSCRHSQSLERWQDQKGHSWVSPSSLSWPGVCAWFSSILLSNWQICRASSILKVVDVQGCLFFYRGFPIHFLMPENFKPIHDELIGDALKSSLECENAKGGKRGDHLVCIIGHWRQSAAVCIFIHRKTFSDLLPFVQTVSLTTWHKKNQEKVDAILKNPQWICLKWVSALLSIHDL